MKHIEGYGSILKSRFVRGVVSLVAMLLAFALAAPSARATVPADFAKTFTVTVPAGLVDAGETLASFPLLLRLGTGIAGFDYADFRQAGADILVADANGNALPYELENWDTAGESRLWVRVPSVAAGTTLTVYYGTAETVAPPAGMWIGYAGVWHINEAGDGATTIADSTANGQDGTSHASSKARSDGKLGAARGLELGGKNGAMTTVPSSAVLDALVPTFTVSGWVRPTTLAMNWGYLFARKTSDADPTWGLQFRGKDGNSDSVGIYSNGSADNDDNRAVFATSGLFTANQWTKYHVVYDDTTIRLYLDGALVASKSANPGPAVSKSNGFGIGGFPTSTNHSSLQADQDEVRLMNGAASAAWVAAEYRQESGAVALSYGAVGDMDATAPVVAAPVLSRDPATGAFTVTAELSARVPASVVCDADGVTNAMATADASLPMTYAATLADLAANTSYSCLVAATSTGGSVTEMASPTVFYNGDLSVSKVSDAYEGGLVPGAFRISRADTAHDLAVAYTISGTATAGQTYKALSGTATIPAGSSSVDVPVQPLRDRQTDANATVVLTLAAGLYGIDAVAGGAELTIVNHRVAQPTDFRKTMTFTPSATVLATIGESTFSDFPVLVRLPAEASATLHSADGTDLFFTDENDAELSFEVDTFDPAGETLVWVKVPSLSASTELTAYFGGAANEDNVPADVWSRYAVVVHGGDSLANAVAGGPAVSAGSSSVAANADAGRIGGGVRKSEFNAIGVNAENVASALANTGRFSVSAWFKRVSGSGKDNNGTHILAASRPGWDTGSGFVWLNEKGTYMAISAPSTHQFASGSGTLTGDAWGHAAFAYEKGVSLTTYLNGAQDNRKTSGIGNLENTSGTWTFGSYANTASGDSFKGDMDELRIFDGVASGDWIALEYATVADAAFFDQGAIEDVDSAAPFVGVPVVTRTAGVFSVSAEISTNVPASVFYEANGVTGAMTTSDAELPMTYSAAISGLSADTTYRCSVLAVSTGGSTVGETCQTAFHTGDLAVTKISDADETSLAPGVFRISRADTAHDLAVAYTVGGTAVAGRAYAALSGTATIPAGSSFVDVAVAPILDAQTDADATVVLTLAAGLYGIDANAGSATLTIVNHHVAAGVDFAKKVTLAPSETVLAKIGESAFADFPVLVRLPAAASAEFRTADGSDLLFTDENGTSLPFEVDTFEPAGETLVWVKVPSLTASTELTAWFGGAANIDNDPAAVWSDYVGVWHMDEASGSVADATGHGLTASVMGDAANSVAVEGAVGNGRQTATAAAKGYLSVPNYDRFGLGNTFTMSGWVKISACTAYPRVFSRKANYADANGWEMEMSSGSMANFGARGSNNPSYSGTFNPALNTAWSHLVLVYDGATLTVYQNGAQVKTGAINAATDNGLALSFGCDSDGSETYLQGAFDECRLMDGTATADGVALDWLAQSDPAFFDAGAVEDVDPTAQKFQTPTVARNANGTYTVTVVLSENSGDVGVIYDAGETAITNILATAANPGTYTDTPANLTADTTYKFAAYGKNANGTEVVAKGGIFYNGDISVTKVSDADENGLVPGVFRISRVDTAHDLAVAYTVEGTATPGQTFETLSGTATIPAGSTSVDVEVVPLLDADTTEDTTVVLTLNAGLYGIDAQAGSAEMTVVNLVAPVGYNTWIAPADGLASVGSNWSTGNTPTSSDNILFDGRFSTANCEWDSDASATVASWTQTNGYTGTVTLKTVYPGKGDFQCLTVTGPMAVMSGAITHPLSRTMGENHPATWDWVGDLLANETYRLRLAVGSLTVGADGLLDAKGKGYRVTHGNAQVNASHGGRASQAAQRCYGDPKEPIHIGLADKTQDNGGYYNGKGGGAIYVTSLGPVVVDGTIRADSDRDGVGDCGAAGSVYLNASSVSGTGRISAFGPGSGDGNWKGTGGRVAIVTDEPVNRATFSAITADSDRKSKARYGGTGTVFFKDRTRPNGLLVVGSPTAAPSFDWDRIYATASVTTDGDWTFDAVEFGSFGFLVVPAGTTLTLPNGLASCTGIVASASAVGGIRYEGGTLDIGSGPQTIAGNWMFCAWSNYVFHADVTMKNGGLIGVHPINERVESGTTLPAFVSCDLAVDGDLTVESTGAIVATDCGFRKNRSDTHNGVLGFHSHGGRTLRWGRPDALFYEGYDSIFSPRLPGCSVPVPDGQTAGRCGGAVKLAVSGTLTLNGPANANGLPEAYNQSGNASGGAGGAIDITAGRLAGAGSITANGGCYLWQRGPGGRIAVKLTSPEADFSSFSGTIEASGRARNDGYKGPGDASAGTVYLQTGAEGDRAGTVRIAMGSENRFASNTNTTEMVSLGYGGDAVADYKKVKYVVRDYGRAAVNADMKAASIEIADENSSLDLEGHTLTVKSATVNGVRLATGTYAADSTVAIGEGTLGDYLVDTAEGAGGELIVKGGGFQFILR